MSLYPLRTNGLDFRTFRSNSLAGISVQHCFPSDPNKTETGRAFYRLTAGGTFRYAFLFSNTVDGTFGQGETACTCAGRTCDPWTLESLSVTVCPTSDMERMAELPNPFTAVTFGGQTVRSVAPGEVFQSDPVELTASAGDCLCIEIRFRGSLLPCHAESILPVFRLNGSEWIPDSCTPRPVMIGCDRPVRGSVGFWGDSITQGIGAPANSYRHWNAEAVRFLPDDRAYWNLGIGCGRASDAATCGSWFFRAKQNEAVCVCFGVNDILNNEPEDIIRANLARLTRALKKAGCRVLIQTIPPFDYQGGHIGIWLRLNEFIRETLAPECDGFFDCVPVLTADPDQPWRSRYGSHPDAEGCAAWGRAVAPAIREMLERV